jgi:hypothetical protein
MVMVPRDQGAPPTPTIRDHKAVVPEAPEALVVVTAPTIGGVEDVPMFGNWSIPGVGIIDLDKTELLGNNREIFETVVECVFADSVVMEAEVSGAAASVATASVDAGPHLVWHLCRTPPCRSYQCWARAEMSGVPHPLPCRKWQRGFSESPQLAWSRS